MFYSSFFYGIMATSFSRGVCAGTKERKNMTSAQLLIMGTIIAYLCFVIITGIMIGRRS